MAGPAIGGKRFTLFVENDEAAASLIGGSSKQLINARETSELGSGLVRIYEPPTSVLDSNSVCGVPQDRLEIVAIQLKTIHIAYRRTQENRTHAKSIMRSSRG